MSKTIFWFLFFVLLIAILLCCFISYKPYQSLDNFRSNSNTYFFSNPPEKNLINCCNFGVRSKALLSSRFKNLEHLKTVVSIKYDKNYLKMDSSECLYSVVHLSYESNGEKITRIMTSGLSQTEILNIKNADYLAKAQFILNEPSTIRQRKELENAYILARRKPALFGPGDMSFYDLALASVRRINTPELAFQNSRDSSDKGYINTFNHVTAQAIITSFFSESLAESISDLHERYNMPELTSGRFTESQLIDTIKTPEDNYVDIINNEIGQKIGLELKAKYKINDQSRCTPVLLTAYLNDIQSYYMQALEIGLDNFRSTDRGVIKFSNKINTILKGL